MGHSSSLICERARAQPHGTRPSTAATALSLDALRYNGLGLQARAQAARRA